MRYYFPIHINGGNRGCEAITLGTVKVLGLKKEEYIGMTTNSCLDKNLGLYKYVTLVSNNQNTVIKRAMAKIRRDILKKDPIPIEDLVRYKKVYNPFLDKISTKDVCMITGGDMFCYGDNELNYIINQMHDKGIKTILWGCSFGPENLTSSKLEALKKLSAITARESLTYDYFSNVLNLKNVLLVSDPAFTLIPQSIELPAWFQKDVIGINLSNFVREDFSKENLFINSLVGFIEYIFENTKLEVALIPHVFWSGQDDRVVCELVKRRIKSSERIHILDTERMNYCQIRYVISKCKFFVGARTHSMISAYSTFTPALALGYSIKSKGIAKDLGLDERLVIDYKTIKCASDLIERFKYMEQNEISIKNHLKSIMSEYITKAYTAKNAINMLTE